MMQDSVRNISEIEFDPKSARRRTERSSAGINGSLRKFGPLRSLVGQKLPNGRIIVKAGNGTQKEAIQRGINKVRLIERRHNELVMVVADDLTPEQWAEYAVADNRTSDLSDWDFDQLQETHTEVDLGDWFSEKEIEDWDRLSEITVSGEVESDPLAHNISGAIPLAIVLKDEAMRSRWAAVKDALGYASDQKAFDAEGGVLAIVEEALGLS